MSDPFFDFPACAEGIPSPAAVDASRPLIQDCSVPKAADPVYQCPPPPLPDPGFIGVRIIHIRVTASADGKHDWIGVDMDDLTDAWVRNGLSGAIADGSEALEYTGATIKPGQTVYLAHYVDGSRKVMFTAPRMPFHLRLTGGPATGRYAWQQVVSSLGAWVPGDDAGTVAFDPAREGNGLPAIPGDGTVYRASRTAEGQVVFHATSGSAGYYLRTPAGGIDGGSWGDCTLLSLPTSGPLVDTGITAPVYNGAAGAISGDSVIQAKIVQGKLTADVEYCEGPPSP